MRVADTRLFVGECQKSVAERRIMVVFGRAAAVAVSFLAVIASAVAQYGRMPPTKRAFTGPNWPAEIRPSFTPRPLESWNDWAWDIPAGPSPYTQGQL